MELGINPQSEKPLHEQAEAILRQLISKDEYQRGKFIPNEVELSEQLNISRNTLRQAINKLVFEGLLIRKRGIGTKVVQKGLVSRVQNWLSFSQEMKRLGIEIRNYELHVSFMNPREMEIRNFFNLPNDDNATNCLVLERVRGNKEFPFVYFKSYFNPEIPFTVEENFAKPLYEILEKDYNVIVKTSKEEIRAALAGSFIAKALRIDDKDPILIRKRFVYDQDGKPIEFNIGYYRADSFTYTIEATR
uniref:GntR family transcriptional regulator n=3 Tax=unclassified Prevotella TaxID=2638335 RepID=A0AB33IZ73_9BACT